VALPLSDTDPDTERVHVELLRASPPERRLRLALSWSRTTMSLAKAGLARRFPEASPHTVNLQFLALLYGAQLADEVRDHLTTKHP
jgi:hypothetical protein